MATVKKTTSGATGVVASIKEKVDALKAVAESATSTQQTHRSAIDSEAVSTDGFMKILGEQCKQADTPEERATIRQEAKDAQARHTEKVSAHTSDSNSVFKQVLGFGAVALGLTIAGVAMLKAKK